MTRHFQVILAISVLAVLLVCLYLELGFNKDQAALIPGPRDEERRAPGVSPILPGARSYPISNAEAEEGESSRHAGLGTVQFLSYYGDLIDGISWTLTRAGELIACISSTEPCLLPVGQWNIQSSDSSFSSLVPTVSVSDAEVSTIFVVRVQSLDVEVRSADEHPIPNARIDWDASRTVELSAERKAESRVSAVTDSRGRAIIPGVIGPIGTLRIYASGYQPRSVRLTGPITGTLIFNLQDSSDSIDIEVCDSRSSDAIATIPAFQVSGFPEVASTTPGYIQLPSWISPWETIRIGAPGYCKSTFDVGPLRSARRATLHQSVSITIALTDDEQQPIANGPLAIMCAGATLFDQLAITDEEGRAMVDLPWGQSVQASALIPGLSGTAVFVPEHDGTVVPLVVSSGGVLELVMSGEGLIATQIDCLYGPLGGVRKSFSAEQSFEIPSPDLLSSFSVESRGFISTQFQAIPTFEGSAAGRLRVALVKESPLAILLQAEDGSPVTGLEVLLFPTPDPYAFVEHRDLQGGWPTEHPAWMERHRRSSRQVSGVDGCVTFRGYSPGKYDAIIQVPPALDPGYGSVFGKIIKTMVLTSEQAMIVVPRPNRVTMDIRDAITGAAVDSFLVSGREVRQEVQDGFWDGWCRAEDGVLVVSSEGYSPARVPIGLGAVSTRQTVLLVPESAMTLTISGAPSSIIGERLQVEVLQELIDEDTGEFAAYSVLWTGDTSAVGSDGMASLAVPFEAGARLRVSASATTGGPVFSPETITWQPGGNWVLFTQ